MISIYYYELGGSGNDVLVGRVKTKANILPRIQKYVKKNWDDGFHLDKSARSDAKTIALYQQGLRHPVGEFMVESNRC